MVLHSLFRGFTRTGSILAVLTAVGALSLAAACDKVPLLAPSGSVITLFPTATVVPVNGSIEIVATVIENGTTSTPTTPTTPTTPGSPTTPTTPGTTTTNSPGAGTPVHNGTVVNFTTTLGRIEPAEARTQNGQVRVRFIASGQSGLATITAFSGGASGKIENLRVGTAGAERVIITATPQALGCTGGTTQINARVEDTSGAGIPSVPVQFTTTTGQLNPSTANTGDNGVATTQLTTTREAEVTANVAGKTETVTVTLSPRTGLGITPPSGTVAAGVATSFTVNVSADANIGNVTLDFGDGTVRNLGAISGSTPVPHTYALEGTYTVTATAADAAGCTERVSTAVNILPAQPPDVRITAPQNARVGESVTVSATVSGATSTILRYEWTFGPDAIPPSVTSASRTTSVRWLAPGTKTITVRVIQANGVEGDAVAQIVITQ
jgi:hypothetical protein